MARWRPFFLLLGLRKDCCGGGIGGLGVGSAKDDLGEFRVSVRFRASTNEDELDCGFLGVAAAGPKMRRSLSCNGVNGT